MIRKSVLRKYARSLAEVGHEEGLLPELETNFRHLVEVARQVPEFMIVMRNPALPLELKTGLVREIAARNGYHRYFTDFVAILISHYRMAYLEDIFELFLLERDELTGKVTAQVSAARDLDPKHQEKLAAGLETIFRKGILMDLSTDPDLIGGLKVQVGGTIYDGSIRRQLDRLRQQLVS